MNYYEFLESNLGIGDMVETLDYGIVYIESMILDGDSMDEKHMYEDRSGIVFLDDDDVSVFVEHGEIRGLSL